MCFLAAALLAAVLRLCQMLAFTEYKTGFIERENHTVYIVFGVIIALLALAAPAFALMSAPVPKTDKAFSLVASLLTVVAGVACVADVLFLYSSNNDTPHLLKILCVSLGSLCAAYFAACGVRSFLYFPFSSKLAAIPPAFFTMRAACVFIACSRHAVVSDTVFEVVIYCALMLLFLEIARAANGAGSRLSPRKITFSGLFTAVLSICFAVPKIALSVFYSSALHDSAGSSLLMLTLGLYSAALVFTRIDFTGKSEKALGVYYTGKH